jgi:predicted ATPase
MPGVSVPRIEYLRVRNYRALHDVEMKSLSPLTVLLGPNGSGKSTLFDVFAFLAECFTEGLRRAWDRRGRFKELRTRGEKGPIVLDLKYREKPSARLITYHLAINEDQKGPIVEEERLEWPRTRGAGRPFRFLDYHRGQGHAISGEEPDEQASRVEMPLSSPEYLAVSSLGQFAEHPRISALRDFITGWYVSYLTAESTRSTPEAGPQERLSKHGDNLPNVIQYLNEQHPARLMQILDTLTRRVPRLERVISEPMPDGRLLLQIKDAPFERPILARFASDGTLKMLSYLTVLYDPSPPSFIGIEEPENHLHPRLLHELCEECRDATSRSQVLVTTHSPFFVNGLRPEELWVLHRDVEGFTRAQRASLVRDLQEFVKDGALLGELWMEGYFDTGNWPHPRKGTSEADGVRK